MKGLSHDLARTLKKVHLVSMAYRPGIEASRIKRMTKADAYALKTWLHGGVQTLILKWRQNGNSGTPPIPRIVAHLKELRWSAARGGPVTFNTVQRVLDRMEPEWRDLPSLGEMKVGNSLGLAALESVRLVKPFEEFRVGDEGFHLGVRKGNRSCVGFGVIDAGTYREFTVDNSYFEVCYAALFPMDPDRY